MICEMLAFEKCERTDWSFHNLLHTQFIFTYTVGEKLAGEKMALGLRPCAGLVSGVCSSFLPTLFCNKKVIQNGLLLSKQDIICSKRNDNILKTL
jgi:hypothetical protein